MQSYKGHQSHLEQTRAVNERDKYTLHEIKIKWIYIYENFEKRGITV